MPTATLTPPRPRIDSPVFSRRAEQVAHECKTSPGVYVLFGTYPRAFADRIVSRTKLKGYPAFRTGSWDATRRRDQVWIMYVGPDDRRALPDA